MQMQRHESMSFGAQDRGDNIANGFIMEDNAGA